MSVKTLTGSGVLYTERRNFLLSPSLTKELWTDVTPFTTVVSNRSMVTGLKDPLFKMFEHRSPWIKQQMAVNGTAVTVAAAGTESNNIDVDGIVGLASSVDSSYEGLEIEIWDSTLSTRKGIALITTAVDSNTIKVKHIFSPDGQDFATADNDVIRVIGNARGDGSVSPEAWSDELSVVFNSTQYMRTPVEIKGALYYAALNGYSNELARIRVEKSKEHAFQREQKLLFGGSVLGTGMDGGSFGDTAGTHHRTDKNGDSVRMTTGVVTAIQKYGASSGDDQNLFTIDSATYKYSNFVDDMEKVFQYLPESGEKTVFAGRGAISYWSKMAMAANSGWNINLGPEAKDGLGFNVRRLETPHGILKLIPTPAFRGPWNKTMLVVSDENLQYCQFRPDEYHANIKTENAYDGVKDEYTSDVGIGLTLIESHKLFTIK